MIRIPGKMSWWGTLRATASVMKEVGIITIGTHMIGVAVAVGMGWGNPFVNRVDPIALQEFTVSAIASLSFVGTLIMCPLIPLLMSKASARAGENESKPPSSAIVSNAWIVMRQSVRTLALAPLVPGAATMLLLWVGAPVVAYNLHTLFSCIAVNVCSVYMASNYRWFRRRQAPAKAAASPRLSPVHPEPATTMTPAGSRRRNRTRHSWRRSACRAFRISVPSTITAMVAIQYITISRRVAFDSVSAFVIFAVTSSALKTLLPVAVKSYIARTAIREPRNTFFMMAAPLFHIEIQLRMAMLKAQATTPLVVSSGFVNIVELGARAASVAFDFALVRRAEKRLARKKAQLSARVRGRDDSEVQTRLLLLDEAHETWKKAHLRVCAAEMIAGMAAEYCGIGLITIFKLVLRGNASIDLPQHLQSSNVGIFWYESQQWATQVFFEIVTDVLATLVEIRMGIPVLEVIKSDVDSFIRWAIAITTAHASGVCLSSFIAAG